MPKLIVLRGPAGAGKSTVARRLFEEITSPVALIELDHYRFTLRNQVPPGRLEYGLAESAIELALRHGCHVIFEGNFRALPDDGLPLPVLGFEGAEVHAFYLDVSLAETLRRHASRTDRRITAERMVELYPAANPIRALDELVLGEDFTVERAVETIRTVSQI